MQDLTVGPPVSMDMSAEAVERRERNATLRASVARARGAVDDAGIEVANTVPMTSLTNLADTIWARSAEALSRVVDSRDGVAVQVDVYAAQIGYDWWAEEVTATDAELILENVLFTDDEGVFQGAPAL